jgi:serine/threonine-protein kinase
METGPLAKLGKYEVKEKIASGGMATVYRAVQTGAGGFRTAVALKILHPHLSTDAQFKKMFKEEARIGGLLNHRCLLKLLEYGEEEGVAYIATEYFPSVSLEELAQRATRIPLPEALFILAESADGLEALHEAKDGETDRKLGLVHRDVSPQNILIGLDGRVKVIDYGIVKKDDATEKTRVGVVKGKIRYMAPEQAAGGQATPRSDIYALGVVFLRCVSGQRPHGSGNTGEILARAKTGLDWKSVAKRTALPDKVAWLLNRALNPSPTERQASAQELANEARAALAEVAPNYGVNEFKGWVVQQSAPGRKKRGGAKRTAGPAEDLDSGLVRFPAPVGPGIHPKWILAGMGLLFLAALVAHFVDWLLR